MIIKVVSLFSTQQLSKADVAWACYGVGDRLLCSGQPASEPTQQHLPKNTSSARSTEGRRPRSCSVTMSLIRKHDDIRLVPLQLAADANVDTVTRVNVIRDMTDTTADDDKNNKETRDAG